MRSVAHDRGSCTSTDASHADNIGYQPGAFIASGSPDAVERDTNAAAGTKDTYLAFENALVYARALELKSKEEWEVWRLWRPTNIPSHPENTYAQDGWQGYEHWLGSIAASVRKEQEFLTLDKALLFARSLNLKTAEEWRRWNSSGARPANIPSSPEVIYKHSGWQGWQHWLGVIQYRALSTSPSTVIVIVNPKDEGTEEDVLVAGGPSFATQDDSDDGDDGDDDHPLPRKFTSKTMRVGTSE